MEEKQKSLGSNAIHTLILNIEGNEGGVQSQLSIVSILFYVLYVLLLHMSGNNTVGWAKSMNSLRNLLNWDSAVE